MHNISQIHNKCYVELRVFHVVFLDICHIQTECGEYPGIPCGILSVPHNNVTDMNNVMYLVSLTIQSYIVVYILLCISFFTNKGQIGCLDIIVHLYSYLVKDYTNNKML